MRRSSRETRDDGNRDLRRYRCTEEACDWQGLLPRLARRLGRSTSATGDAPWKVWLVPLALLAVVVIGVAALSFRALQA